MKGRFVVTIFLSLTILLAAGWAGSSSFGQQSNSAQEKAELRENRSDSRQGGGLSGEKRDSAGAAGSGKEIAQNPGSQAEEQGNQIIPSLEETPLLPRTVKIDEAGEKLSRKIEEVGQGASRSVGSWINAEAFFGITWLKLFVCFGLLFLVLAGERILRHIVHVRIEAMRVKGEDRWSTLLATAIAKPLSLFIRIYGIYWALSPIWGHFDPPDGPWSYPPHGWKSRGYRRHHRTVLVCVPVRERDRPANPPMGFDHGQQYQPDARAPAGKDLQDFHHRHRQPHDRPEYDRHRNRAAHRITGNRRPCIRFGWEGFHRQLPGEPHHPA